MPSWSFLSNHGAVLVLVATQPRITATEIGSQLGITERPVRRIIAELEAAGYIRRTREGRANRYEVNPILPLPGPVLRDLAVGDLIDILQARLPKGGRDLRGAYPSGARYDGWRGPAPGNQR